MFHETGREYYTFMRRREYCAEEIDKVEDSRDGEQ
jgi:hypothetical protein